MRITTPIVALVLLGSSASGHGQEPFRSGARTVAVYATVTDATGQPITDLTRDDFEIFDNGKRQAITLFESGAQPITDVLMLDRSGSMQGNFNLVRSAAEHFVGLMVPGDKARIGSFANRIQVDPRGFTSSQRDLIEILRTQLQEAGPTPLWNAVNVGITSLLHQDGRRVVLVFTDGIDLPLNGSSRNISLKDAMKNAEREDVMVYAIGLASSRGFSGRARGGGGRRGSGMRSILAEQNRPDPGLPRIAQSTGGHYFELSKASDLSATFSRVVEELRRQYAIAFTPEKLDGKTHKLEVRVKRPGASVRTRRSYVARAER